MNTNLITCNTIDEYLWKVERYLMKKYGVDQASRDADPLKWYIRTGRACPAWIRQLMEKIPYNVAKILHKGGSYEDAIERVHNYIGWQK